MSAKPSLNCHGSIRKRGIRRLKIKVTMYKRVDNQEAYHLDNSSAVVHQRDFVLAMSSKAESLCTVGLVMEAVKGKNPGCCKLSNCGMKMTYARGTT